MAGSPGQEPGCGAYRVFQLYPAAVVQGLGRVGRGRTRVKRRRRMFFLSVSTSSESGVKSGATTHSTNIPPIPDAVSRSTGRLTAITEPNAETGSVARARSKAAARVGRSGETARGRVFDDADGRFERKCEGSEAEKCAVQVKQVVVGQLLYHVIVQVRLYLAGVTSRARRIRRPGRDSRRICGRLCRVSASVTS